MIKESPANAVYLNIYWNVKNKFWCDFRIKSPYAAIPYIYYISYRNSGVYLIEQKLINSRSGIEKVSN